MMKCKIPQECEYCFEYDDKFGNKGVFYTNNKFDFYSLMKSKIEEGCKITYEED